MYKLVILDLDGTLLDTITDLAISVNYALKKMNYKKRSFDEINSFIGNGVVVLISRAVPEGTSEENQKLCLDIFREHYLNNMTENTRAYPVSLPSSPYTNFSS